MPHMFYHPILSYQILPIILVENQSFIFLAQVRRFLCEFSNELKLGDPAEKVVLSFIFTGNAGNRLFTNLMMNQLKESAEIKKKSIGCPDAWNTNFRAKSKKFIKK